jgi:hypothetical protein
LRVSRLLVAGSLAAALAACGILQPTPARFRPPLPDAQPMPRLIVEDVTTQLAALGYGCSFDPGGDIPSSWSCVNGDGDRNSSTSVGLAAGEVGPIERVTIYEQMLLGPDTGPEADVLDRIGATAFAPVLEVVLPAAHLPTDEELLAGVHRNYPIELGSGWFIGFDRNAISRTMYVIFAGD